MIFGGNEDTIRPLTGADSDLGAILGTRWAMVNQKKKKKPSLSSLSLESGQGEVSHTHFNNT